MPVVKFYRPNHNRGKLCGMAGGRNAPSRRVDSTQRRGMASRLLRLEAELENQIATRAWMMEDVRLHTANEDGTRMEYRPEARESRQEFHDRMIRYYTPKIRLLNQDIISREIEIDRLIRNARGEMVGGMEAAIAELGLIAFEELQGFFGYSWEKKKKKNIEFLEKIIDGKVMGKNKKEMKNITEQMKKRYMRVYIPMAKETLSLLEKVENNENYDKWYEETMKEFLLELNYFSIFLKEQSKLEKRREKEEKRREKEEKKKTSNDEVIRIENPIKPETPEKKKEYSKETIELKNKIVKELLSFYKKVASNLNIPKNEIMRDIKKIAKGMARNYRVKFINDMIMMLENQDIKVEEDEETFLKYMMKKIKLASDENQIIAEKSGIQFRGYDVNK